MDWWKLFSGTFILIFLAELGDKTQLAAMAKTADSPDSSVAKWVVFLAASSALVFSTFVAVFLGNALKSLVPDERYIKLAAGLLFLLFGGMILLETYKSYVGGETGVVPAAQTDKPGMVGQFALSAAMDFESFTGDRYRRLAAETGDPGLANLLLTLAGEEDSHLERLRRMPPAGKNAGVPEPIPLPGIAGDAAAGGSGLKALDELIRHEQATAEFYRSLAVRTVIPTLGPLFARLAAEEESHAERLSTMAATLAARNA